MHFPLGGYLLEQDGEGDIFEECYDRGLIVVEHLLGHNVDQQDVAIIYLVLLVSVGFGHHIGEGHLLFPAQAEEAPELILNEDAVDLTSFEHLK